MIGVSVGFIRPWFQGLQYHLDSFYVAKAFEGQKIGSRLLAFIKKQLSAEEIPDIILDKEKGFPAEHFYRKNGFCSNDEGVTLFARTLSVIDH